jgi:hypothetical protein
MKTTLCLRHGFRRRTLFALVALGAFVWLHSEARAATRWETLEAIHAIENPYDQRAPGPCGELGAYQFRQNTWRKYSQRPFNEAIDRQCSDEVAVRHYEWIKSSLERNRLVPSTYNIALAWNAGLTAVVRGRVPASSRDYAERVENIATDLHRRQLQVAVAR